MQITFRPANPEDFDYCAKLYFSWMEGPDPDISSKTADLRRRWDVAQVRIVRVDDADIGWLQSEVQGDALYLAQLFIETALRGQGIGSGVMHRLIEEGRELGRGVTLGVVKTNPALKLYARLGFQITHEDERKYYMRRELHSGSS